MFKPFVDYEFIIFVFDKTPNAPHFNLELFKNPVIMQYIERHNKVVKQLLKKWKCFPIPKNWEEKRAYLELFLIDNYLLYFLYKEYFSVVSYLNQLLTLKSKCSVAELKDHHIKQFLSYKANFDFFSNLLNYLERQGGSEYFLQSGILQKVHTLEKRYERKQKQVTLLFNLKNV